MKFGGSSLADAAQIERVVGVIRDRAARRPFVVCSAHKGVTDLLARAALEAAGGRPDAGPVIERQSAVCTAVGFDPDALQSMFEDLDSVLRGVSLVREVSPRVMDFVLSFGERMSVRTVAHAARSAGLDARAYDAFHLGFITDANFGRARPLPDFDERARPLCESAMADSAIPIVTGFVGKTKDDSISTVGRNGSDFTATCFAAALAAEECQIWTDTDGVMTADPSLCASARNIPRMSFAEASELAQYGGRVLHPSTLLPAMRRNIPVRVLNTNQPNRPGTVITKEATDQPATPITSVAYKEAQQAITVQSASMLGQPGFLARVFDVLGRHDVDVDMVSTSEVSVSMTTGSDAHLQDAIQRLEELGTVRVEQGRSLLCVVGPQIRSAPGIAARVFAALESAQVNVEMISHGASNINLSMLVRDEDVSKAVPALHDAFFA